MSNTITKPPAQKTDSHVFTVTKSTVECYKLRSPDSHYWADITLDSNGEKGRIQIASDFGSWQYYWGSCGKQFKLFLCGLNKDYMAGKFSASHWFDFEKTLLRYREMIVARRREEEIDADKARKMWDEVKLLEDSGESEFTFVMREQCDLLMRYYDYCPPTCNSIHPHFEMFWKIIWPSFIRELRSEVESATP